ncbi:hypothetical protein AAC387_Pa06g2217 [Persea americana]
MDMMQLSLSISPKISAPFSLFLSSSLNSCFSSEALPTTVTQNFGGLSSSLSSQTRVALTFGRISDGFLLCSIIRWLWSSVYHLSVFRGALDNPCDY